MSTSSANFSKSDVTYLLTFAAGMGAFWLSGHLPRVIPTGWLPHGRTALYIMGLTVALVIYGLCMLVWSLVLFNRSMKPALVATFVAVALALVTSLTLTFAKLGAVHTKGGVAVLLFVLYMLYGLYFTAGWLVAKRLIKDRG